MDEHLSASGRLANTPVLALSATSGRKMKAGRCSVAMPATDVRTQLADRRQRIELVMAQNAGPAPQLEGLLRDIDAALDRLAAGTYGICETCHDPIEQDRLAADPLLRFCIDHLTPSQARALEQDLQLASRVQLNLLPPSDATVDGWRVAYRYEPSGTVSGDYVDLVRPLGASSGLFFLFGDIAGKGVAASMLMAHLHASVRTLINLGLPLPQVVERANRVFCESTMANHYATLVGGRLMPTGGLEICNAGHCPPIQIRRGTVAMLDSTSVPIGLFCAREYPTRQSCLDPGDSLLLYTDGITEAVGRDGSDYGADRLGAVALAHAGSPPAEIVSACLADLEAFTGGAPRADDRTLMVIRRV